MKFGDRLRQAREARGITLEAIFQETYIAKRYLEALERSDIHALPGGIFDKGYIRSYAKYVGIDPEPVLEAYRVTRRQMSPEAETQRAQVFQEMAVQSDRCEAKRSGPSWPIPMASAVGLAVLGLAVLVAGIWLLIPNGTGEDERERQLAQTPRPNEGASMDLPSPVIEIPGADSESGTTTRQEPDPSTAPKLEDSAPAQNTDAGRLRVAEAGLGTSVVEHALNGRANRFAEGTRVFFWNRVLNGDKGMILRHIWKLGDEIVMNSELTIGGPHWRTYSSYTLPPGSSGNWTVDAIGPDGRVLFHEEFVCYDSPDLETAVRPQPYRPAATRAILRGGGVNVSTRFLENRGALASGAEPPRTSTGGRHDTRNDSPAQEDEGRVARATR